MILQKRVSSPLTLNLHEISMMLYPVTDLKMVGFLILSREFCLFWWLSTPSLPWHELVMMLSIVDTLNTHSILHVYWIAQYNYSSHSMSQVMTVDEAVYWKELWFCWSFVFYFSDSIPDRSVWTSASPFQLLNKVNYFKITVWIFGRGMLSIMVFLVGNGIGNLTSKSWMKLCFTKH